MQCSQICSKILLAICATLILVLANSIGSAAETNLPTWPTVRDTVTKYFAAKPGHRPFDLISQNDVEPVFDELRRIGLPPRDVEAAADGFLPSNSILVVTLSSEPGRAFMRKVSKFPEAYDRLERLTWLEGGQNILRELIANPNGPKQVERWTTTAGAKEMAAKVAKDPRGMNFSLPTGHMHTAEQLIEELKRNHDEAAREKSLDSEK